MTQRQYFEAFLREWRSGEGFRVMTSGSTGSPKSILLPHSQVERSARRTVSFFNLGAASRLHSAVSFQFIGGKMMIARSLVSGAELSFCEPSLSIEFPPASASIDLMSVVPAQLPHILKNKIRVSNVGNFLIGGSAIDNRLWDKLVNSGLTAWESYGMTETASHIAVREVKGSGDCRAGFKPLPGIFLDRDEDDCLVIHDEGIVVKTNDIVDLNPDGSFYVRGRKDDVIITGGLKVFPQKIEAVLRPFLADICTDFFVTSVPDEIWTSRMVIVAVPLVKEDMESQKKRIKHALDSISFDVLERRLRPKNIFIVPSLPLTPSGKLNRKWRVDEASGLP